MTTAAPFDPMTLWTHAFQTWTEGWTALASGSASPGSAPTDPLIAWRRAYDRSLAAWTGVLEDFFHNPTTIAAGGQILDNMLNIEKPLRAQTTTTMTAVLDFFNLPSRNDIVRVAGQLNDANARLDGLQDQVTELADQFTTLADSVTTLAGRVSTLTEQVAALMKPSAPPPVQKAG